MESLSLHETMRRLGCGKSTFYKLISEGALQYADGETSLRGGKRVTVESVEAYLDARGGKPITTVADANRGNTIRMAHTIEHYLASVNKTNENVVQGWGRDRTEREKAKVEERLRDPGLTFVTRAKLLQRLKDHERRLEGADTADLAADFIAVAKVWGDAQGIEYSTWRELGVPADVLREAGYTGTPGRRKAGEESAPRARPNISEEARATFVENAALMRIRKKLKNGKELTSEEQALLAKREAADAAKANTNTLADALTETASNGSNGKAARHQRVKVS